MTVTTDAEAKFAKDATPFTEYQRQYTAGKKSRKLKSGRIRFIIRSKGRLKIDNFSNLLPQSRSKVRAR